MLSKMITINSNLTSAQAYDEKDNVLEPVMFVRTDKGIVESGVFELYQNEPNPFSKETVVSYRLPESGAVKLTVYDVTGKVLRVYEMKGQKGLNHQQISKGDLNATGVLYYQLDAADHTATKKDGICRVILIFRKNIYLKRVAFMQPFFINITFQ